MKMNFATLAIAALVSGIFAAPVSAATFVWTPSGDANLSASDDLGDLDHNMAYTWGMNFTMPVNETIESATLTIKNINNWDNNPNKLFVHLLPQNLASVGGFVAGAPTTFTGSTKGGNPNQPNGTPAPSGTVKSFNDPDGDTQIRSFFANVGTPIYEFVDVNGTNTVNQVSYSFDAAELALLNTYLTDATAGHFALGFDPDCHYWNDGMSFTIVTRITPDVPEVPEPATLALAGLGAAAIVRRRVSGIRS